MKHRRQKRNRQANVDSSQKKLFIIVQVWYNEIIQFKVNEGNENESTEFSLSIKLLEKRFFAVSKEIAQRESNQFIRLIKNDGIYTYIRKSVVAWTPPREIVRIAIIDVELYEAEKAAESEEENPENETPQVSTTDNETEHQQESDQADSNQPV